MAPHPTTLFELFGDFSAVWPVRVIAESFGDPQSAPEDAGAWLAALNSATKLTDIRTGALGGRTAVEATVAFRNAQSGYPDPGLPFVLRSMTDVEFRLLDSGANPTSKLFVGVDDAGRAEVLLEGVPVEIRLPVGLVAPNPGPPDHPSGISSETVGTFEAGNADDLAITYANSGPTTIQVHVRLHFNADGDVSIRTPMPISFGSCLFSGIPCKAVHDFSLIPSPSIITQTVDWIRTTEVNPVDLGTDDGAFGVRSIHLDMEVAPLKGTADWLKGHADKELPAEVVIDDLVVPFLGVPRHFTVGIRRGIVDPTDPAQVFAFEKAPSVVFLTRDPSFGLIVERLFARLPPVENPEDNDDFTVAGVSLAASLFLGGKSSKDDDGEEGALSPQTVELSFGENQTPRLTYRRAFDAATGLPAAGEGAGKFVNAVFHHKIAGTSIDVMAMRAGFSIGKITDGESSWLDSLEATIDIFVSVPPSGDDDALFRMRALDGEKLAFGIEGIGWYQGDLRLLGSGLPALPGGVVITICSVNVVLQEIGLLAEQGATYLSTTAGVEFPLPNGFDGAIVLKRARFMVSGATQAPRFLLDGIFARVQGGKSFLIEAGGYFTETTTGDTRVREFGMSGTIELTIATTNYYLTLDVLLGSVRSPREHFRYFMLQALYGSAIIGSVEMRNARLLFANNLQPKLAPADVEAGELRYYNWHRASNPLNVPGDRRLVAWQPQEGAWAFGIGAGVSLPSLGKLAEFNAFILGVDGPDEHGALITGEVTLMSNEAPIAYFALEWDGKSDRISLVIGVDVALTKLLTNPPAWSENVGKLSGTLFVTNKPGTFAIGRLKDQRTWLALQFDVDFFVKSFARIAFCLEQSKSDSGMGMVISLEGGVDGGRKFQIAYLARFGWLIANFSTGSSDGAATIAIEFAVRAVLFRFLNVGVSLSAELRYIGNQPSRGEALIRIRFETPWFLPDLTWTLDCTFGESDPAGLGTSSSPLRQASAMEGPRLTNVPLHLARFDPGDPAFDPDWDGSGPAPTFSVRQFSAAGASEAERVARFEADTAVRAIATDATIAIDWNVAVNDQLSLGADLATGSGSQSAGELDLTYDLIEIKVRRRRRFGADRAWRDLEARSELGADFSDPDGVQLEGEYGPQTLAKLWDMDVRIEGKTAAKRLLLNAATPFSYTTRAPEIDEETVAGNPTWPCCPPKDEDAFPYPVHVVEFRDEPPGRRIVGDRIFSASASRLMLLRHAIVRPSLLNQLTPPEALIAALTTSLPGPFLRAELDEAAAFCALRIGWSRSIGLLDVAGFDTDGRIVAHARHALAASSGYQDILLPGTGPIHRLEARLILANNSGAEPGVTIHNPRRSVTFEVDRVSYVGLRDYLDAGRLEVACEGVQGEGALAYAGAGKLFFLPNHDYEVAVTTRLTIGHPSTLPEAADVTEYVYFRTKGLPGLNAVERVGEEIEPYVAAAYAGGRGHLYREEPVTLAFSEDFLLAVPLDQRPAGSAEEAATLQQLQLLAAPDIAAARETVATATSTDWIVDNRDFGPGLTLPGWISVLTTSRLDAMPMRSRDPFRARLAKLTQRSSADCVIKDPRDVTGSVLIARPQGEPHPLQADAEIWPSASVMTATARANGAAYIDARAFVPVDKTAFTFATEAGGDNGGEWSVADGQLRLSTGSERRFALFGETTWNHLSARVELTFEHAAGVGLSLPQSSPSEGLFAILERVGSGLALVLYSRASGGAFTELMRDAMADAPAAETPLALSVELFDDRLRARCLDLLVELPRSGFREGRMALLGEGQLAFSSLQVRGLDFYAFAFRTSRYNSFAEHIESFSGTPATAAPDALGTGTTSATVANLYAATRHEFTVAMQPDAPSEVRQSLFDRWIEELALPIRQDVQALAITRYIEVAETALLLIESPEPIDFIAEVVLQLAHLNPARVDRFRRLASAAEGATNPLRAALMGSRSGPGRPPRPTPIILSASEIENGLRVTMNAAALGATGQVQSEVVFAQRDPRSVTFFKGKLPILPRPSKRITVEARRQNSVPLNATPFVFPIVQALEQLKPGMLALLSTDLSQILDVFQPPEQHAPLQLDILQDAPLRRALIVPHDGMTSRNIEPGPYKLSFTLSRQRFPTEDPADATNHYTANASIEITL